MLPDQLVAAQMDLVDRLNNQAGFQRFIHECLRSANAKSGFDADRNARAMLQNIRNSTQGAHVYRVTPDMCLLLEHAASLLDESDLVDTSLAPTGCGLVRFERPLPHQDVRGRTQLAHWLVWGPTSASVEGVHTGPRSGVMATWFNDIIDKPDTISQEMLRTQGPVLKDALGRFSWLHSSPALNGDSVGPSEQSPPAEFAAEILANGDNVLPSTNPTRYLMALWMLLGQSITNVSEEHVRKTRVGLARQMNIPGRVSVVQLRRVEGVNRERGESTVQWAGRWVVRGHWRWQPYGEGRLQRRRIWIAPFVKGPEGAPLVVPDKIYDLRR